MELFKKHLIFWFARIHANLLMVIILSYFVICFKSFLLCYCALWSSQMTVGVVFYAVFVLLQRIM